MSRSDPHAPLPLRQWPLLAVVAGVLVGLAIAVVSPAGWRVGCLVMGFSLVGGGLERIVLTSRRAGLLQVRSKPFDVTVLLLAGAAVLVLAVVVPPGR